MNANSRCGLPDAFPGGQQPVPALRRIIAKRGHEAVHVRDLGLATADDPIIFDRAAIEDRILVAQDTDFGTILALRQATRPSVILFRSQIKSTTSLIALLLANLSEIAADLMAGAVVVIEDSRIRTRRLPTAGRDS